MRVLITNDDGPGRDGLAVLTDRLGVLGLTVCVAVPSVDISGCGGSFGRKPDGGVRADRLPAAVGEAWTVDGTPGFIVMAAFLGAFGPPPDLVVSGINFGCNEGRHVLYSGTVGAAQVARQFGVPALAISQERGSPWHVETGADVAAAVITALIGAGPVLVNVNVPNRLFGDLAGVRAAGLAPFRDMTLRQSDGSAELVRCPEVPAPADCDRTLIGDGFVTVTVLDGYRTAAGADALAEHASAALRLAARAS